MLSPVKIFHSPFSYHYLFALSLVKSSIQQSVVYYYLVHAAPGSHEVCFGVAMHGDGALRSSRHLLPPPLSPLRCLPYLRVSESDISYPAS